MEAKFRFTYKLNLQKFLGPQNLITPKEIPWRAKARPTTANNLITPKEIPWRAKARPTTANIHRRKKSEYQGDIWDNGLAATKKSIRCNDAD